MNGEVSDSTDTSALGGLFRRHAGELRRFLRNRRGLGDAEDIVQEGFIRLLQNGSAAMPDNAAAWLHRTCANLAADSHDYRSVRERFHVDCADINALEDTTADPAQRIAARQQLLRVWFALHNLPTLCRHAFLLNRLDGMSQKAIAKHLGISEKTVERHVLRALETCKRTLDEKI